MQNDLQAEGRAEGRGTQDSHPHLEEAGLCACGILGRSLKNQQTCHQSRSRKQKIVLSGRIKDMRCGPKAKKDPAGSSRKPPRLGHPSCQDE